MTRTRTRQDLVTWAGLAVVLVAAAVLSFHALRDLAITVRIAESYAWLLPIAVDAGAAVSCACWLSRSVPEDASHFARSMTWALLAGTVIGNAAHLGMTAAGIVPPWWAAVLVGAIPPAVVGGTVHLAVLVGRGHQSSPAADTPEAPPLVVDTEPEPEPEQEAGAAPPALVSVPDLVDADDLEARLDALLAEYQRRGEKPPGRRTLASELGLDSDYPVRRILEARS